MKKILDFLKKPKPWFSVAAVATFLISASASIYMLIKEESGALFYAICAVAAVSLSYFVYLTVLFVRNAKTFFLKEANKRRFTKKFVGDYSFRSACTSLISFIINVGYAAFMGVLGIMYRLIWYGALAGYYLVLSFLRIGILSAYRKNGDEKQRLGVYKRTGFFISVLAVAMIPGCRADGYVPEAGNDGKGIYDIRNSFIYCL